MKLKIKKGVIYEVNEDGTEDRAIGTMLDNATEEDERTIECGSELLPKVEEFIEDVNSGKFKPKATVKNLEDVLKKYAV